MDAREEKQKLVIWGASSHAKVVADIVRLMGNFEIVGFLDDLNPHLHGSNFCGATILGGREQLKRLHDEGVRQLIFAFGKLHARLELSALAKSMDFSLATAIHPGAIVASDVQIGPGTMIGAGVVITPDVSIGENVIISACASVHHGCFVEDGVHICPGVHLAGGVRVGRAAWVGIGSTVIERVRIGAGAKIGAGAVVTEDVPDYVLAAGVPARIVRKMAINEN